MNENNYLVTEAQVPSFGGVSEWYMNNGGTEYWINVADGGGFFLYTKNEADTLDTVYVVGKYNSLDEAQDAADAYSREYDKVPLEETWEMRSLAEVTEIYNDYNRELIANGEAPINFLNPYWCNKEKR